MKYSGLKALFASALVHIIAFFGLTHSAFLPQGKQEPKAEIKEIEIISQEVESRPQEPRDFRVSEKKPLPYQENIMERLLDLSSGRMNLGKNIRKNQKIESIFLANLIDDKDLTESPAYMDYYRLIREKIRKTAYQSYSGRNQGIVYINFSIKKDGNLEAVELSQESTPIDSLKRNALESIRKSAPFPPFPKELSNHSYLQFNISIHFRSD